MVYGCRLQTRFASQYLPSLFERLNTEKVIHRAVQYFEIFEFGGLLLCQRKQFREAFFFQYS